MKNIGKSIIGVGAFLGACLIVLITYISLLGENKKIDSVVDQFFENIQAQRYFSIEDNQNVVNSFGVFDTDGEYSENCLFLELALLEKYNISDASGYKIDIEKSRFWIPFISSSNIHIDLALEKPENFDIFSLFKKSKKPEYVNDLFTVKRKNGRWLITAINVHDSSLFESFNRIRDDLNIDGYVSISGTNLTVKPIAINTANITTIEKRKLHYISRKLSQLIESDDDAAVQNENSGFNIEIEKPLVEKAINNSIGWAKNKDIDLLYSVIANDANYIEVDPDGKVVKGFRDFKKNEDFWMNADFKAIRYEIKDLAINFSMSGNTAWFFCILDDINEWKGNPANWENTRWTGVLEKREGNWVIVQMHFSFAQS